MKRFLILALIAITCGYANAQSASLKASVGNEKSFSEDKLQGKFIFKMPETATKESVKQAASYYTDHFSVEYNPKTFLAVIKIIDEKPLSKKVVERFMISNGVKEIIYGGKVYTVNDFVTEYVVQ